jgi:hypothetical protein
VRSKEVEEAIEILKHTGHEDDFTWFVYALGNVTGDSIDTATETALNYIEKLEKLPNKIRDKIEEYKKKIIEAREEDDDNKEFYYEQEIEVLQELLEEEK